MNSESNFVTGMLIVVTLYSAVLTLMVLTGAAAPSQGATACSREYVEPVVSRDEIALGDTLCKLRAKTPLEEVGRGHYGVLDFNCGAGFHVTIKGVESK